MQWTHGQSAGLAPLNQVHPIRRYTVYPIPLYLVPFPDNLAVSLATGILFAAYPGVDSVFGFDVSQIIGIVQQVGGVSWVRVDAFQPVPLGSPPETDPTATTPS